MRAYRLGEEISLALDVAATEIYREGKYQFEGKALAADAMVEYYEGLVEDFSLVSIEDGLTEDDWEGWTLMTRRLGERVQLVGDDIFVTNEAIAADEGSMKVSPTQSSSK